jgi:hypothetical protein
MTMATQPIRVGGGKNHPERTTGMPSFPSGHKGKYIEPTTMAASQSVPTAQPNRPPPPALAQSKACTAGPIEPVVRRIVGLCAIRSDLVIKWDLCRTFSCLAATEPMDACGSRRWKVEAPESQGQQTRPLRRPQTHGDRLRCGRQ